MAGRALFLVSFSGLVHAQPMRTSAFVDVGLSLQNDGGMPRAAGSTRFQLSPIGLTAGVGSSTPARGSSGFDFAVRTTFYPLLSSRSTQPLSSEQTADMPTFLVLGSINVRWTPDRTRSSPWFVEGGIARAFRSPRDAIRNSLLIGGGISRWLSDRIRGDVALELVTPRIGATVLQVPALLSVHVMPNRRYD